MKRPPLWFQIVGFTGASLYMLFGTYLPMRLLNAVCLGILIMALAKRYGEWQTRRSYDRRTNP